MSDPPILERAARALAWKRWSRENPELAEHATGRITATIYDEEDARAVLQAIREPSEAMMTAAAETPGMKAVSDSMMLQQARGYAFDEAAFKDGSPLQQAWRASIDSALSE